MHAYPPVRVVVVTNDDEGRMGAVRTLVFVVGGLFLFLLLLFTTQRADRTAVARTCLMFIGIWLLVTLGNLIYGVTGAGHSIAEEVPIALIIFVPPAAVASIVWWRSGRP